MALQGVLELLPLQVLLKPVTLQADLGMLGCSHTSHRMGAALLAGAGVAKLRMPHVCMLLAAVGDTG